MPVHDWTTVSAGVFHDFHVSWIPALKRTLNEGVLPPDYYAIAEQVSGEIHPDVLSLHAGTPPLEGRRSPPRGATAVADAPPRVTVTAVADEAEVYATKRRTLVIRHSSGDRVIALIEILSPGNKSGRRALDRFLDKAISALRQGIHLLLVDLFPPGAFDSGGIHGAMWEEFESRPYRVPEGRPFTLAAYAAGSIPRAYVEQVALGADLPAMPLFLDEGWYVNLPLEASYREAYASVPERWRRVIEAEGP